MSNIRKLDNTLQNNPESKKKSQWKLNNILNKMKINFVRYS